MNHNYTLKPESVQEDMKNIASDLMNNWALRVGETKYQICEIEFYYNQGQEHHDPYLHGHDLQNKYGRWYFHGSGLDFTIGTPQYAASILIRAILNLQTNEYTYGPLMIVSELFNAMGSCKINQLNIGIEPRKIDLDLLEKPIASRRVGLNPDKNKLMHSALYRFLIMPKQKHADKSGIEKVMRESGKYSETEIKGIWG